VPKGDFWCFSGEMGVIRHFGEWKNGRWVTKWQVLKFFRLAERRRRRFHVEKSAHSEVTLFRGSKTASATLG